MAILNIKDSQVGLVGVDPQIIFIETSDTYTVVTTAGYLNAASHLGYTFTNNQMALVNTSDSGVMFLEVEVTTSGINLKPAVNPGTVITPTITDHIATYLDTAGTLTEDPAVALTNYSIQALDGNVIVGDSLGSSDNSFISYSKTGALGRLELYCADNGGNYLITLKNASHAQNTTLTIPNGGAASSNFIISNSTGTQSIATGNLNMALGSITLNVGNVIATDGFIQASNSQVRAGQSGGCADNQFISFSLTAAMGQFRFLCTDNSADILVKVTNASHAQNSTYSIPDSGETTANLIISKYPGIQQISSGSLQLFAGSLFVGNAAGGGVNGINIYPTAANKGYLQFITANNAADYFVTVTNASHGQNTIVTIPDGGNAASNFIISNSSGTQHITTGTLQVDQGNFIVGTAAGSAGGNTFFSYSPTALRGNLRVKSNDNTANFDTTLTQAPQGQTSTYSIPDGGQASSNFIISDSAGTQSINTGSLSIASPGNMTVADGNYFVGNAAGCTRNGYFSYSMTAAKGKTVFAARDNAGDYLVRFSNQSHAQDSEYLVPDSGSATSNFIVSNHPTTQYIATGNLEVVAGSFNVGDPAGAAGLHFIRSYPATAAKGYLGILGIANAGDYPTLIENVSMGQSTTFRLPDPGVANTVFVVNSAVSPVAPSNVIYKTFFTEISYTALAGGAFVLLQSSAASGVWGVLDITINDSSQDFAGGVGNRNIAIQSYTGAAPAVVYSIIPAATLAAIPNARWGSVNVPAPVGFDYMTLWGGGDSLVAMYDGGTTDYTTAGVLKLAITLVQVS